MREDSSARAFVIAPMVRVLGLGVLLASAAGLWLTLSGSGEGTPWPAVVILGFFGAASTLACISNFGERVTLDGEGILRRNLLLEAMGWKRPQRLPWSEVRGVLLHRRRTVFVLDRAGRRHVFDQMHPFRHFYDELTRRAGLAAVSAPEADA